MINKIVPSRRGVLGAAFNKGPFNKFVTLKTTFFNPHPYVTLLNDRSILPFSYSKRYVTILIRIYKILNLKVVLMTFTSKQA